MDKEKSTPNLFERRKSVKLMEKDNDILGGRKKSFRNIDKDFDEDDLRIEHKPIDNNEVTEIA